MVVVGRFLRCLLAGILLSAGAVTLGATSAQADESYSLYVSVTGKTSGSATESVPFAGALVTVYPATVDSPGTGDYKPSPIYLAFTDETGLATIPVPDASDVKFTVEKSAYALHWSSADTQEPANWTDAAAVTPTACAVVADCPSEVKNVELRGLMRVVHVNAFDKNTAQGLSGADVNVYDSSGNGLTEKATTKTDADGNATFQWMAADLPLGTYRLSVKFEGYPTTWYRDEAHSGNPNDFVDATDIDLAGSESEVTLPVAMSPTPPKEFTTVGAVSISGEAKKGLTLTAHRGKWKPTPTLFTYTWYRGPRVIVGATSATYKLVKADVGSRIKVKVSAERSGYQTTSVTSPKTKTVTTA